jgi:hypothetical protein
VTWVQALGIGFVAAGSSVIGRSWVLTAVDERAQALAARGGEGEPAAEESALQASVPGGDAQNLEALAQVRTVPARQPDADQALIVATAMALLMAAGPVYVVARILVG